MWNQKFLRGKDGFEHRIHKATGLIDSLVSPLGVAIAIQKLFGCCKREEERVILAELHRLQTSRVKRFQEHFLAVAALVMVDDVM
jgi:hypothetical protein